MRNRTTRIWTLPAQLLSDIDDAAPAGVSRSRVIDRAIDLATGDPQRLTRALQLRLANPPAKPFETRRVGLTTDEEHVNRLHRLAEMSGLPLEVALRLALEAYLVDLAHQQDHYQHLPA